MAKNNEDFWIDESLVDKLLSSEDLWTDEFWTSMVETQPVSSHNSNVPPMMLETTSLSNKPLEVAVEASPTLSSSQKSQRQREKRITWTVEEHRRFLEGLHIYKRGHWKKISEYIQTKSTTQVTSHAQKYFLHQNKTQEQKKRKSIHDTVLELPHAVQVQERIHMNAANQGFSNDIHPSQFSNVQSTHQNDDHDEFFHLLFDDDECFNYYLVHSWT